jgi:tripeptidyl-peptidase-1
MPPDRSFPVGKRTASPSSTSRDPAGAAAARSVSADCRESSQRTPSCVQQLYGIPSTPAKPAANALGVSTFGNGFANHRDLKVSSIKNLTFVSQSHICQLYLETYRPDMNPNTTYNFVSIDNGVDNQLPLDTSPSAVCGDYPPIVDRSFILAGC